MKKLITAFVTFTVATTLLSACGWHLRGTTSMPLNIQSVYVAAEDSHGSLITDLKRALASSNVTAAESAEGAQYQIYLSNERQDRRTVSVGNAALAAEYELSLKVNYRIEDANGVIIAPTSTASNFRSYNFDRDAVVAKAEEERLIQQEMRNSIVQQILTRLRFTSQTAAATAAEGQGASTTDGSTSDSTTSPAASGTTGKTTPKVVPQPDPDAVREAQEPIEPLTDDPHGQIAP